MFARPVLCFVTYPNRETNNGRTCVRSRSQRGSFYALIAGLLNGIIVQCRWIIFAGAAAAARQCFSTGGLEMRVQTKTDFCTTSPAIPFAVFNASQMRGA